MANDISLFNLFSKQQANYENALKEREKIAQGKKTAVDLALRIIDEDYKAIEESNEQQISTISGELDSTSKQIKKYSNFDGKTIGNILAFLVKVFEDKDLVYESGELIYYVRDSGWMGAYDKEEYKILKMLIPEEFLNQTHEYRNYQLNQSIIIEAETPISKSNAGSTRKDVTFYSVINGKIVFTSSFDNCSYLKEYIDFVINYRILNKKEIITKEELIQLLKAFIFAHYNMINPKYQDDINESIRKLEL